MKVNAELFKSKKFIICMSVTLIAVVIAITYAVGYNAAMNRFNKVLSEVNERQIMYAKLSEVDQVVRQNYLGQIDEEKLRESMCSGYISGIDQYYAEYLDAEEYKSYSDLKSSKYSDIGIQSINTNGNIEVVAVVDSSPAQKADIQKGDIITAIDSKSVKDIGYDKSILLLSKAIGSKTQIDFIRNSEENKTVEVTHESYQKNPVTYTMLENNTIGKITISEFSSESVSAFDHAVSELKNNSAQSFILDLRNCKGNEITYAAQILDKILPDGALISTVDKNGESNVLYTSNAMEFQYPIAVLVNSGTSGAGELVASAIKDYQKGEVIGQTTAGNTTLKKDYPLSDGSAIIIDIAHYTTKSGNIITNVGVTPTKEVELSSEKRALLDRNNLSINDDDQVQSAIELFGGVTWTKFLEMQEIAREEQAAAEAALAEMNQEASQAEQAE